LAEHLFLVYDGECPFCSTFARYVRVRNALGDLRLFNAREGGPLIEEIKQRGIDLNEGMVLVVDDEYYFGSECMNRLALMSTGSGLFNALNGFIFSRPLLAKLLYPLLKFGRRVTLKLLGRSTLK
jgi:predicted DCC family thiol-disulfide oxidoreductase YuxK